MTNKSKNPAIIFLNPPYGEASHKLTQDIIKFCKSNNLSIVKIIQAKGIYDTSNLYKLMHKIRSLKKKPITIIIDKNLKSPINIIQCCVLETLISVGLVEILMYEIDNAELKFKLLGKGESNLLHGGAIYFGSLTGFVNKKSKNNSN